MASTTDNQNNDTNSAIIREILELKKELGQQIIMPAHHYQKPEVVSVSDFVGDSYKLSKEGAAASARFIVFCGVRFMAESAAILAAPGQTVLIPDPVAGCPMADMIDAAQAETILDKLDALTGLAVAPLTYMNSYADMKALTGRRGGAICTSSNAARLLKYYLDAGKPVFFGPDFNLGINVANDLGIDRKRIFRVRKDGTLECMESVTNSVKTPNPSQGLMFIWDGFCHVHKTFKVDQIHAARSRNPGVQVIVHPESDEAVVQAADSVGSTEGIYKAVAAAAPGSRWVVGTEASFVHRLAAEYPDRSIVPLRESYCFNMARITLDNVLASLRSIKAHLADSGKALYHIISVDPAIKADAALALNRMIDIVEGRTGGAKH